MPMPMAMAMPMPMAPVVAAGAGLERNHDRALNAAAPGDHPEKVASGHGCSLLFVSPAVRG